MMGNKTTILSSIFSNRKRLEAVVSLNLLKNPSLFDEYRLTDEDFKDKDAKQITRLASLLQTVDTVNVLAIDMIFDKNKELKEYFDDFGGSQELVNEMQRIDQNNFETFYEELIKQNYILELKSLGFDVSRYADKFKDMSCEDIKDWLEYNIIDVEDRTTQLGRGLEINDLELTDEMINDILNGEIYETLSYSKYSPILNGLTNGLVLGTTMILGATSGAGKSTFTLSNIVYPIIKEGNKVVIISNELTAKQYMMMLISIISYREFGEYLQRDKLAKGNVDKDKTKESLIKIQSYINENLKHSIKFINYNDGNIDVVIRAMKKCSKLGFSLAIYDTAKPESSKDARSWANLLEDVKKMTFTAQECNMALLLPTQVMQSANDKRILNKSLLSESKGIVTVASTLLLFRRVKNDEMTGCKFDCKPYRYIKCENGGWEREELTITPDKQYIMMFVDKNRFGSDGKVIIYEFVASIACYRELGYCTPVDDYR